MPSPKPAQRNTNNFLTRIGLTRGVLIALVLSVLIHGLFVVTMTIASYLELPFAVQFDASQGVGIMSRIGQRLGDEGVQTAPRPTRIIDITPPPQALGPASPSEEELRDMAQARETLQAEKEKEAQAAQAAKQAEAAKAAAERDARRKRRRDARKKAEREKAERRASGAQTADKKQATNEKDSGTDNEKDRADTDSAANGDDQKSASAAGPNHAQGNDDKTASASSKKEKGKTSGAHSGPRLDLPPGKRYPKGTINPVATDLSMWGPEGARLVVVVRNDRLRRSPHAKSVRSVLDSFPDWRTLVGGADVDPLREVDTTVIASADPRYINQTFLAAMHHMPAEKVVGLISQGDHGGVTWRTENGRLIGDYAPRSGRDPRKFFIPTDGVFVLSRPAFMDDLSAQAPTPRGLDAAIELASLSKEEQQARLAKGAWTQDAPSARRPDHKPPTRDDGWLRGIMDVADYGGTRSNGAAAMISTGKISSMRIKGYQGTMPQRMHANIYADSDVRITGRMVFEKKKHAEALRDAWPDVLAANRGSLNITGLYRPLLDAELSIDHNEMIFEFIIPKATVRRMGVSISQLMEMR